MQFQQQQQQQQGSGETDAPGAVVSIVGLVFIAAMLGFLLMLNPSWDISGAVSGWIGVSLFFTGFTGYGPGFMIGSIVTMFCLAVAMGVSPW